MNIATDKPNEACAVFGVSLSDATGAAGVIYDGLLSLQHRGQEGAGIAVVDGNHIICHKNSGLVGEVFSDREFDILPDSRTAVGHTLYSAYGGNKKEHAGPFVTEYLTGRLATSLNGKISNAAALRYDLTNNGLYFDTSSDGEVVSSLVAYCVTKERDEYSGVVRAADILEGAFSFVIACGSRENHGSRENRGGRENHGGDKLIAVRDPNGFRPLCIGRKINGRGVGGDANRDDSGNAGGNANGNVGGDIGGSAGGDIGGDVGGYVFASESCALDACGFEFIRDVAPGEVVLIENGKITRQGVALKKKTAGQGFCIFEFVYLARPDSVIDGLSVYNARYNMGYELASEFPADADVVCGVPDTGLEAASGYSAKSGIPLVSGFFRNRYIGRSFIYPTQIQRESAVRLKLNPLSANTRGKRVVMVEDSVVRGTTLEPTVKNLKSTGAKEVHLRIASPPFRHMCGYGTDIDREENLLANKMDLDEICRMIGADSLGYLSMGGLKRACAKCALPFCSDCFSGRGEGGK